MNRCAQGSEQPPDDTPAPVPLWADVRAEDGTHLRVMEFEAYARLPATAERTIAFLFVRSADGSRIDLGTPAQLAARLRVAGIDDYRTTKVAR